MFGCGYGSMFRGRIEIGGGKVGFEGGGITGVEAVLVAVIVPTAVPIIIALVVALVVWFFKAQSISILEADAFALVIAVAISVVVAVVVPGLFPIGKTFLVFFIEFYCDKRKQEERGNKDTDKKATKARENAAKDEQQF